MDTIPTLPRLIDRTLHRTLSNEDLKAIFRYKSFWSLYYASLVITGLRSHDLAILCHRNINRSHSIIGYYGHGTKGYKEISVPRNFLDLFPEGRSHDEPVFPTLFSDTNDFEYRSEQLNENLGPGADFLEALLAAAERPAASLIAFKVTHDDAVQAENDNFFRLLISRINDPLGCFDRPEA